jgi:hypothetical protein
MSDPPKKYRPRAFRLDEADMDLAAANDPARSYVVEVQPDAFIGEEPPGELPRDEAAIETAQRRGVLRSAFWS